MEIKNKYTEVFRTFHQCLYALSLKWSILSINNRVIYTRMIKKYNQVTRYSEFHVNVCYNLQPVHNEFVMFRLKIVTHVYMKL